MRYNDSQSGSVSKGRIPRALSNVWLRSWGVNYIIHPHYRNVSVHPFLEVWKTYWRDKSRIFLSRRKVATRMEAGSAKHPGAAIRVWKARHGQSGKGMWTQCAITPNRTTWKQLLAASPTQRVPGHVTMYLRVFLFANKTYKPESGYICVQIPT